MHECLALRVVLDLDALAFVPVPNDLKIARRLVLPDNLLASRQLSSYMPTPPIPSTWPTAL